jgi:predicted DNA-binding transcriptional regulator AlpA
MGMHVTTRETITAEMIGVGSAYPLMKTPEAADHVGLAKNTLDKMRLYGRRNDNSPRFIKLGAAVRYRREDLDAWIMRNRAVTTSEYDPNS